MYRAEFIPVPDTMSGYEIREAQLKDGFCNYVMEVTEGHNKGDRHKVDGSSVHTDDLAKAFERLNVHLACIDDVFKHAGLEIDDIDKFHSHDLAHLYRVGAIKLKGSDENVGVILIGSKDIYQAGGRIELVSPKIPIDGLSSYKWYNELKDAVDHILYEVKCYREGKIMLLEDDEQEEEKPKSKRVRQMTIVDQEADWEDVEGEEQREEDSAEDAFDLASGKV